ncbi:MAG TPA: thiamine pyrophosphate-dependent enzyme [Nevskiaceae bacterium]|nr:thiamine pyrophosphate-dependent enzyme [Nevskiaceae bacterium]
MADPGASIEQRFHRCLRDGALPRRTRSWSLADAGISPPELVELFESQVLSRQLDYHARRLRARNESFYTIGSAGHEGNAAIAKALRVTDPAFLHYRDAAFFIQRAKSLPGQDILRDLLLSFVASADDPIAGGRHKVIGSRALNVPPQTSTIASQLPKAVGAAYSLPLWKRLGGHGEWPDDSVVVCSFGDASFNHSTAQGAINTAAWAAYQSVPVPLILVCEDNGLGVSVRTPAGWIEASMRSRPGFHYLSCDGLDLLDTLRTARQAEHLARVRHQPVFLHMHCVRLLGHAGADAQEAYLSAEKIEAMEARDPLLFSAAILIEAGVLGADQIIARYEAIGEEVRRAAPKAIERPKLRTAADVMASIVPPRRASRMRAGPDECAVDVQAKPMARLITQALDRLLRRYPHLVLAGEDIGRKGGVYGVTLKLQATHGAHRVIDTLLDEQSILGLGLGLAHNGLLPVVEIQYLAYLHNAEDQLRGEAATLPFFSKGQFTNPMVVRIAGLAYQKGFGGHFHNDNAIAVLRDIPGLLVACPSNGVDAVGLLQEAVRLADEEQRVVVFLEPIALYHTRDLHAPDDGLWSGVDPGPSHRLPPGEPGCWGEGRDLAIVSFGNGVYLSRQAAPELERRGIGLRIVDLRWLTAIDHDRVFDAVRECRRILIVDECRRSGSVSEELMCALAERQVAPERVARITAEDSFIPLGIAATCTLPSKDGIVAAASRLCGR